MTSSKVYNIPQIFGNKIKPTNERFGLWLLTENLCASSLITDIGNINYTNGEDLLVRDDSNLIPITDPFCDNIMLVKVCGLEDCEAKEKGCFIVKKEICGKYNSYLRGKFSKFVSAKHGVKAKLPYLLNDETAISKKIIHVIGNMEEIREKYKDPVGVPYKVELANVKLETILEELPQILDQLKKEYYYLLDLDITQDFAGVFNKKEMCDFLTMNHNFCYQGEYKSSANVIVNNDKTVGKDCLTWCNTNARVKIYNKFICQITSPGVNKQIGNHIVDFINCPDQRLRETFSSNLAKTHGITRMEATIYNYEMDEYSTLTHTFNPIQDCLLLLRDSKRYFQNAPVYSVSIARMWTKLADTLENSCCLVYNNLLQYVYWGNSNTKKLTGVQIKLPCDLKIRNKLISYVISAWSFNLLPTNYVEIVDDVTNNNNISVIQKCYIKSGETFFSKSCNIFSTIGKEINLEQLGLVATNNLIPQVLRKRTNLTNKLTPYAVKEIEFVSPITVLSAKKRKLEMDEMEIKRRKMEFLANTEAVKVGHKHLLEFEEEIKKLSSYLEDCFCSRWKNFDPRGEYKVSAFTVNSKGKFPCVGVLAEKEGGKSVYCIKGYNKNVFITAYNAKADLKKEGYIIIPYDDYMDLICLPKGEPFLLIKTNGMTSYNGHSFAKIEKIDFFTNVWKNLQDTPFTQEEVEQFHNIRMLEIKGKVNVAQCSRLEQLEQGVELVIVAIKKIYNRNKLRWILQFENLESLFVSNYWLEKELQGTNIDCNYKIKIKLDVLKHTPNRNKERVVFCV